MPAEPDLSHRISFRDRIKELRRVRSADLRPNPHNWRTHPPAQRAALKAVLSEIGYADALLARELTDGSLELIDGHLRCETTPDQMVPVLVLDVDETEANKILATLDPLAAMAETSREHLDLLLREVETDSKSLEAMLEDLRKRAELDDAALQELAGDESSRLQETYHVLVECRDEQEQQQLLERLTHEGLTCRALFT
jgi:hypothetical protein